MQIVFERDVDGWIEMEREREFICALALKHDVCFPLN